MDETFGPTLGRWLLWVKDRVWPGPPLDPVTNPEYFDIAPESEASKVIRSIHDIGDHGDLPYEVRVMIFGHWLRQSSQPPWDIGAEIFLPDWVTPGVYEEVWFQNTKFILPASEFTRSNFYQLEVGARLEASTINCLARLCGRRNAPQPVTVEVLVDANGDLRRAQKSIHRLLLVSYYLGNRSDLLNIKILVDTKTKLGLIEANEDIAKPLMTRLQQDCANMRKFRDGGMTTAQVLNYAGASPLTRPDVVSQPPEVKVAELMCYATTHTGFYARGATTSKIMLMRKCKKLIRDKEEQGIPTV